jgi:hypothetical protein
MGFALLLAAAAVAGCSSSSAKKEQKTVVVDANALPSNYRNQVARFLAQTLRDAADFRGALIAQPVLKPVGDTQHYVVCIQLNGHNQRKNKVAIYLSGEITQYVDSTPQQCGDAAYQPFKELETQQPNEEQERFLPSYKG